MAYSASRILILNARVPFYLSASILFPRFRSNMSFSSRRRAERSGSTLTVQQKYGNEYDLDILSLLVRHLGEAEGMQLLDRCAKKVKTLDLKVGLPDRYLIEVKKEHHDLYRKAGFLVNQATIRYNDNRALQFNKECKAMMLRKYGKSKEELEANREMIKLEGDIHQFDACDIQVWQDQFTFQITHYLSHIYRLPPRERFVLVEMINEDIAATKFGGAYQLPSLFKYPRVVRPKCFLDYLLRRNLEMAVGEERLSEIEAERQEIVNWMMMKGLAQPDNPIQALMKS